MNVNQNEIEINENQLKFLEQIEPEEMMVNNTTFSMNGLMYAIKEIDFEFIYCYEYEIINEVVHNRKGWMPRYYRQFKLTNNQIKFSKNGPEFRDHYKTLVDYDPETFVFFIGWGDHDEEKELHYQKAYNNASQFFSM